MGDLHWLMMRVQSLGVVPDVWVCSMDPSKDRAAGYLNKLPFVNFKGYHDMRKHKREYLDVFVNGKTYLNWNGFDQFVGVNHEVEKGRPPSEWAFGNSTNYDYPVSVSEKELAFGHMLKEQCTRYFILSFYKHGFYKKAWDVLPPEAIVEMLRKRFPHHTLITTGAKWDSKNGLDVDRDLCGKTDIDQLFGAIKNADVFIGHAAGNAMMATHFNVPTVMLWDKQQFKWEMATCWSRPNQDNYIPWDLRQNKDLDAMGDTLEEMIDG